MHRIKQFLAAYLTCILFGCASLQPKEPEQIAPFSAQGWGDIETIRKDFLQRDDKLKSYHQYQKVVLWFEHDLTDQIGEVCRVLSLNHRLGGQWRQGEGSGHHFEHLVAEQSLVVVFQADDVDAGQQLGDHLEQRLELPPLMPMGPPQRLGSADR